MLTANKSKSMHRYLHGIPKKKKDQKKKDRVFLQLKIRRHKNSDFEVPYKNTHVDLQYVTCLPV